MTTAPPHDPAARTAAFERLGLPETARGAAFTHVVTVLRQLTGAHAVTLSVVGGQRAWCTSGVAPFSALPIEDSPAAAALASDRQVWHRSVPGTDVQRHPGFAALARDEVHVTTVQVTDPTGLAVGALELAFADDDHQRLIPDVVLAAFGRHVSELLELHAEVDEYRRSVEFAPDPIVVLDADGLIVRANPAFAALLDGCVDALLGRSFLELIAAGDRSRATATITRVLVSPHRTVRFDVELCASDGRPFPCEIAAGHLGGPRRHLQLVVHDLTDRQRVAEEHAVLSEQLARAQRLDSISRMTAGLAHDLNNLLGVLTANLELAEESMSDVVAGFADRGGRPASLDALRTDLGELRGAVDRASELAGTLLAFGRRDGGGVADIVEVIGSVSSYASRTVPAGVEVAVDVPDVLPEVAAEPVSLERAVLNLVINARDAVGEAGTIHLRARYLDVGEGEDRGDVGERIVVEVIDDGDGMDAATQARAFDPLFTTKGDAGNGLGLPTVAGLVRELGGELELSSAVGAGTAVRLSLPTSETDRWRVPLGDDQPVAGGRVLLVDPGERTRRVIARMLEGSGFRVHDAATAAEADEVLQRHEPALIVTELVLPDGDGDRLVARARQRWPAVPAVLLSAVEAPSQVGGVPVLVKPFSHARLVRLVGEVLARPGR